MAAQPSGDELADKRPPKAMAVPTAPRFPKDRVSLTLDGSDQEVVEALGAGVLMLWNDLPQDIQRQIFERATAVLTSDHSKKVREELALFLHDHKDD
jgi:hypothetical protein